MKRMLIPLLCGMMLLSSCRKEELPPEPIQDTQTVLTNRFKLKSAELPEGHGLSTRVNPVLTDNGISCVTYTNSARYLTQIDADGTSSANEFVFEEGLFMSAGYLADDTLTCLMEDGRADERNPDYYWYIYDTDALLSPCEIVTVTPENEEITVQELLPLPDGNWCFRFNQTIGIFAPDGKQLAIIDTYENLHDILLLDGTLYLLTSMNDDSSLFTLNYEKRELSEPIIFSDRTFRHLTADPDGNLYLSDDTGICLCNPADGTYTVHCDYIASDLGNYEITPLAIPDSDTVLVSYSDVRFGDRAMGYLTRTDDLDTAALTVIDVVIDSENQLNLASYAAEFNKNSTTHRIEVTNLALEEDGVNRLVTDMITGIRRPDMVILSNTGDTAYQLVNAGLTTDLYSFMDSDPDVNRDTVFGCVLSAYETNDGALWGICPSYRYDTLAIKTELAGSMTQWNIAEFMDFCASLPNGSGLTNGLTRSRIQSSLFGNAGYAMFLESGFDSPDFIRYLELLKSLPEDAEPESGLTLAGLYDRSELTLYGARMGEPVDYLKLEAVFLTPDTTFIGFPGVGNMIYPARNIMITSDDCGSEAWEFVKTIINPEEFDSMEFYSQRYAMPVMKSRYDEIYTECYADAEFSFNLGGGGHGSRAYDPENPTLESELDEPGIVRLFTEEKKDEFAAILDQRSTAPLLSHVHEEITAIVNEEISAYLAGAKSAEDCADIIQSRVNIWLAEHS